MKKIVFWLLMLLGCVICWHPILNPFAVFSGMDFLCLILPQTLFAYTQLTVGEIALWCPYEYCGVPLFAAMQSAQAFPGTWLLYALHSISNLVPSLAQINCIFAFQIMTIVYLVLGAIGTKLFYNAFFGSRTSEGIIAGIVFACNSFLLGHIEQLNSIAAISLIPWYFWAITEVIACVKNDGSCLKTIFLGSVIALGMTSGHPQYLALSLVLGFIFVLLNIYLIKFTIRQSFHTLFLCGGILVFGCMIAAVQILPSHELSVLSERVFPYSDPDQPAYRWAYLLSFVKPQFYRNLANVNEIPIEFTEMYNYSSLLGILLAALAIFCLVRSKSLQGFIAVVMLILTLLFAFGKEGGISWIPQEMFSYFRNARGSARGLAITVLFLSILAAYGMRQILLIVPHKYTTIVLFMAFALIVFDLTYANRSELSERLVDSRANYVIQSGESKLPNHSVESRTYRFTKDDSDYYLDYSATAMQAKYKRLQPNMNYHLCIATTDGYEEGLLPTLPMANYLRQYNRNLRNDLPDERLLAMFGVNSVVTDYPISLLSKGISWEKVSSNNRSLSQYRTYQSGLVYDSGILKLQADASHEFVPGIINRGSEIASHPFANLTTDTIAKACRGLNASFDGNKILVSKSGDPNIEELLVTIPNYPGWKSTDGKLRTFNAISSAFDLRDNFDGDTIKIDYCPFSFRLGLFISLLSVILLTICFIDLLLVRVFKQM